MKPHGRMIDHVTDKVKLKSKHSHTVILHLLRDDDEEFVDKTEGGNSLPLCQFQFDQATA